MRLFQWSAVAVVAAAMALSAAGCQSQIQRGADSASMAVSAGPLLPVDAMGADFFEEQDVRLQWGDRTFRFRAVLQKRGERLELIALDPHARPAFKIAYEGDRVTMETFTDRHFPFAPEYMLADVQKAFAAWPMDAQLESEDQTVRVGVWDGLRYEEVWHDGAVHTRHFHRDDVDAAKEVTVRFDARDADGQPSSVRVENGWFGYTLQVIVVRRDML